MYDKLEKEQEKVYFIIITRVYTCRMLCVFALFRLFKLGFW